MKRVLYVCLLLTSLLVGCSPWVTSTSEPDAHILTVFGAASLTDAFTEIGENFEIAHPGVTVAYNFAGSQTLRTQIEAGAPADVFASANKTEMDALVQASLVAEGMPQVFLINKLVVILPANNPGALERLEDLAEPGLKLVFAAEEVPVGKYARQALDQMSAPYGADFKERVLANVVSNEDNVKQVVAKVQLGEADAGIVYTSDAVAAPDLKTIAIPAELNVIAEYPIAPLIHSANADLGTAFIAYVLSDEGQAILQKWGFGPPE